MWIARDENNELWGYTCSHIEKKLSHWVFTEDANLRYNECYKLIDSLFPEVTWNTEPKWKRFIRPEWVIYY